jgi:hypothetical protein
MNGIQWVEWGCGVEKGGVDGGRRRRSRRKGRGRACDPGTGQQLRPPRVLSRSAAAALRRAPGPGPSIDPAFSSGSVLPDPISLRTSARGKDNDL